jgi:hypothetical protein
MRDDVSLLSNGAVGWIQIAGFVIAGAMVVACAIGVQRALKDGPAATWAPRLIALYGLGLVAAGVFVADPMTGSSSPFVVLGFWVALLVVWGWLAGLSIHLYRAVAAESGPTPA